MRKSGDVSPPMQGTYSPKNYGHIHPGDLVPQVSQFSVKEGM